MIIFSARNKFSILNIDIYIVSYSVVNKILPSTSGVRTHADICPLELKSNALTTRPSCFTTSAAAIKLYNIVWLLRKHKT